MEKILIKHNHSITKKDRNKKYNHKSPVIWLTGLSGSGKSTIANLIEQQLHELGMKTFILDGDNVRMGLNKDLGFSDDDRKENIRRIAETAKLMSDSGTITITAFISPFREEREKAKEIIGEDNFIEIYVNASLHTCEERDPKGLYKKARNGEIPNFTGIDSPYEEPLKPNLQVLTGLWDENRCANGIMSYLIDNGYITLRWGKTNYGGEPTSNKDTKRAVFIGRYQPYHQGHISLIEQKLNEGIPALIMVRDIEPDEKNPFTTEQTVNMIKKYHESKGDDVEVIVIPDIESVNYGRGVGYEINQYTPPKYLGWISASKIRESISRGDESWKNLVDESIQDDVINFLTNEKTTSR
jgi:adenylylsulfate kinase